MWIKIKFVLSGVVTVFRNVFGQISTDKEINAKKAIFQKNYFL